MGEENKLGQEKAQETFLKNNPLPDITFKTQSKEEMLKKNEDGREHAGPTTVFFRNTKKNVDLVFLGLIIVIFGALGYSIARIHFGMTPAQIKAETKDFLEVLGTLALGIFFTYMKIYTKPGPICSRLQQQGNKENIDESGHTIVGNENRN